MGKRNVPRETKQTTTKDFLVSKEEFLLDEIEKGLLRTLPVISDEDISKYYDSNE